MTGREGRKELEFLDFQGIPDERRSFGRTACDKDRARERHRNRKSDGGKGRGPNPVYSRTTSSVKKRKKGGSNLRGGADERERERQGRTNG